MSSCFCSVSDVCLRILLVSFKGLLHPPVPEWVRLESVALSSWIFAALLCQLLNFTVACYRMSQPRHIFPHPRITLSFFWAVTGPIVSVWTPPQLPPSLYVMEQWGVTSVNQLLSPLKRKLQEKKSRSINLRIIYIINPFSCVQQRHLYEVLINEKHTLPPI